jgi:predicted CXXCH cytochrome family protein
MKQKKQLLIMSVILLLAQWGLGQTIVGSAHDFHAMSWNNTNEICIVCHTPHNANISILDAPLWNHQMTSATFQLYACATFNGAATQTQPDGNSKLCLSCHDGTVALENFGLTTTGTHFITPVNNTGTDLRDDHPISFIYDAALAATDPGLYNPTTQPSGMGGTISQTMLYNGKLQCASCHDVHNHAGVPHLLRKSNAISALCLTCHNK